MCEQNKSNTKVTKVVPPFGKRKNLTVVAEYLKDYYKTLYSVAKSYQQQTGLLPPLKHLNLFRGQVSPYDDFSRIQVELSFSEEVDSFYSIDLVDTSLVDSAKGYKVQNIAMIDIAKEKLTIEKGALMTTRYVENISMYNHNMYNHKLPLPLSRKDSFPYEEVDFIVAPKTVTFPLVAFYLTLLFDERDSLDTLTRSLHEESTTIERLNDRSLSFDNVQKNVAYYETKLKLFNDEVTKDITGKSFTVTQREVHEKLFGKDIDSFASRIQQIERMVSANEGTIEVSRNQNTFTIQSKYVVDDVETLGATYHLLPKDAYFVSFESDYDSKTNSEIDLFHYNLDLYLQANLLRISSNVECDSKIKYLKLPNETLFYATPSTLVDKVNIFGEAAYKLFTEVDELLIVSRNFVKAYTNIQSKIIMNESTCKSVEYNILVKLANKVIEGWVNGKDVTIIEGVDYPSDSKIKADLKGNTFEIIGNGLTPIRYEFVNHDDEITCSLYVYESIKPLQLGLLLEYYNIIRNV